MNFILDYTDYILSDIVDILWYHFSPEIGNHFILHILVVMLHGKYLRLHSWKNYPCQLVEPSLTLVNTKNILDCPSK